MSLGLPYDGDAGRAWAGAMTAIMCGQAYLTSARIAEATGPFPGYAGNDESFLEVIRMHGQAVASIDSKLVPSAMLEAAATCWNQALEKGKIAGYRNAQTTVIAPTGTIGFMMDCDTTGIEPELALIKYKKLVGGGGIKIVNNTVPQALLRLGYTTEQADEIVNHIDATGAAEAHRAWRMRTFPCSTPASARRTVHDSFSTWATSR